jgi:hypothetical protein
MSTSVTSGRYVGIHSFTVSAAFAIRASLSAAADPYLPSS